MGEEDGKKVLGGAAAAANDAKPANESTAQKALPPPEEKVDNSKALTVVEKATDVPTERSSSGSINRDAALMRIETEKRLSLIRAWEESVKVKAENKAVRKVSIISSWENTKKTAVEAALKKVEESLERKKAEYAEKMKNKIAIIHKEAEEKRAMAEAKREEELLKAEEKAAKYRATGLAPKKLVGCL